MKITKIKPQKLLSPTQISIADFVINPYRGCAFGCKYCYSQYSKYAKKTKQPWGSFVDVKENVKNLLEWEIKLYKPKKVLIGASTESFQPAEKEFQTTKQILEVLKNRNIPFTILTRSPLIAEKEYTSFLNYHSENKVFFTFMFSNPQVKNILEPKTPPLLERAKAITKLLKYGVKIRIHIGPYIPGLEDLKSIFGLIPEGVKEVEIEFYNAKMGRLKDVINLVKLASGAKTARQIKEIYSSESKYLKFIKETKQTAEKINSKNYKIFFITPLFNDWYDRNIKY